MDPEILIVGYGTVGKNVCDVLKKFNPDIYDKYNKVDTRKKTYVSPSENSTYLEAKTLRYNYAFICVDTPLVKEDSSLDIREIQNALQENDADVYVIKSTVPVGTIEFFNMIFGGNKKIVYSPEYYGSTQHCNNFDFTFTILGGNKQDCIKVQQLLQECYDARHTFHITDSKTAELAKLMENSWIATKVSFCNQFYEIAEEAGVNYEELRELFILDPRVNPAHTFVYRDNPYWDTHCLNKDVPYIANAYGCAELLQDVIKFNDMQKSKFMF